MEIIWLPQDNLDLDYFNPSAGIPTSTQPNNRFNSVALPLVILGCTGVAASTATFRYTVTVNWEAVANNSTLSFLHTSPSPVQTGKLEQAWNFFKSVGSKLARTVTDTVPYFQNAYNGLQAARKLGPAINTVARYAPQIAYGAGAIGSIASGAGPLLLTM